jgi:hypothetical protein
MRPAFREDDNIKIVYKCINKQNVRKCNSRQLLQDRPVAVGIL